MIEDSESDKALYAQLRASLHRAQYVRDWRQAMTTSLRYLADHAPRLHAELVQESREREQAERGSLNQNPVD